MRDIDEYRGDVWYEQWRRGIPEGSISDDRITDGYYAEQSPTFLCNEVHARMEQRRAEREYEEEMQRQYEEERRHELEWQSDQEHWEMERE